MASVRSLDNALEVASNIQTLPQAKITNDDGRTHIPDNGRIIRNLIHGADTVMSHITHFYALAALDFVDVSYLGAPFAPTYTASDAPVMLAGSTVMVNGNPVVSNYVESLVMRRKAHSMGAIFSGRHPIQNAIVPGGVSTLPTASDVVVFSNLLDSVRTFINTAYIPDVVTVANAFSDYYIGTTPGYLLSYGEYPVQVGTSTEDLLISRGVVDINSLGALDIDGTSTPTAFLGNIREYVGYSYYKSPSGLNPKVGKTEPDVAKVGTSTRYSWLKAPRFGTADYVCEVGPMPRLMATYVAGNSGKTVSGAQGVTSTITGFDTGVAVGLPTTTYSLTDLITTALSLLGVDTSPVTSATYLVSVLGRHACRALESKFLADAMADTGIAKGTGEAWLTQLRSGPNTAAETTGTVFSNLTNPVYVYAKLPTKPKSGAGWAEAPRGALCHWINIENKKIANYQCVVPSTWNHSPKDEVTGLGGAAEQLLTNFSVAGLNGPDDVVLTALRALHVWDFCIACAVHIVKPDGSTIAKFKMGTDGSVTKLTHDAEI